MSSNQGGGLPTFDFDDMPNDPIGTAPPTNNNNNNRNNNNRSNNNAAGVGTIDTGISSITSPQSSSINNNNNNNNINMSNNMFGDTGESVSAGAGGQQQHNSNNNNNLERAKEKIFAVLDSQTGMLAFALYVVFAFLITGSIDWTVSFVLFALAVRMVIHTGVSLWKFAFSDVVMSVLGVLVTCLALPLASTTAGGGICCYILLILPAYTEESLLVVSNDVNIIRKRVVQFVGLLAPITVALLVFFHINGGLMFHIATLAAVIVFVFSYLLRAAELPVDPNKDYDEEGENSQQQNQNIYNDDRAPDPAGAAVPSATDDPYADDDIAGGGASAAANRQRQNQQQQQRPRVALVTDPNDPAASVIAQIRERKAHYEQALETANPQAYRYYLHLKRPMTTAVCTSIIFILLVWNVASFEPAHVPSNGTKSGGAQTPATTRNDGGGANPDRPFDADPTAVYSTSFYLSVGFVSAFLLSSVELLTDAFLPAVEDLPWLTPRHRRFALLGGAAVLAFFPASFRLYPGALAMAAFVPWIVWRDSCEQFAAKRRDEISRQPQQHGRRQNADGDGDGPVSPPRIIDIHNNDNTHETNNNQQQQQDENDTSVTGGGGGAGAEAAASSNPFPSADNIVTDFILPTVVSTLLMLLATGAEDKRPDNFVFLVAMIAHGAMAYCLYQSLMKFTAAGGGEGGGSGGERDENNNSVVGGVGGGNVY